MRIVPLILVTSLGLLPGCSREEGGTSRADDPGTDGSEVVRPTSPEVPGAPRVVFLGTSLTEGLGLEAPEIESWPARVGELADSAGVVVEIVNAGISGETSAGALARTEWVISRDLDVLVVETGGNDALRALPTEGLESNLGAILRLAREFRPTARRLLVQMEAPTNLGADYTARFREVYPRVAEREGAALVPFLLDGVAGVARLNQADGIHPTAEGHRIMARNAWPAIEQALRAGGAAQGGGAAQEGGR